MEVEQDCKSTREHGRQRLYLEYLIDCPPCPREERRRLDGSRKLQSAGHRRRRAGSSSTADNPVPPARDPVPARSLPVTPTTETACPLVDDGRQRPAEFQRRMSPFRRGPYDRVRRPASATAAMSETDSPPQNIVRPEPLRVDGHPDGTTADTESGDRPRQVCSLQAMVRHRRTGSNTSNNSTTSNASAPEAEQQQQQHEQVRPRSFVDNCHFCFFRSLYLSKFHI